MSRRTTQIIANRLKESGNSDLADSFSNIALAEEDLTQWEKSPLMEKVGYLYVNKVKDWEGYDKDRYFHPIEVQKNGRLKGIYFAVIDGKLIGKAKLTSIPKMDLHIYKKIDYRDIPPKVATKIGDKLKTINE